MDESTATSMTEVDALEVYWRPGCPYCYRLLDALEGAGVTMVLHNIWEDDAARAAVAAINHGNETVPTIALGELKWTNPSPGELLALLRAEQPQLLAEATSE
jgi:mycoredoxin